MDKVNSFYNREELESLGFNACGKNVLISKYARFYNPELISLGDNVRIDDFCILSGNIIIGDFVHLSAYCTFYGKNSIEIKNYCGTSPRTTIYSQTDDFSGNFLIGPMHETSLTNVTGGKVVLNEFVQLGANTIVFPNVVIGEGSVTGAFSLVTKSIEGWGIYAGIPAVRIKDRSKKLLELI